MSIPKLEFYNAEEIHNFIIEARSSRLEEPYRSLIQSLSRDYELWFTDSWNDMQAPTKKPYNKWAEGDPAWILAKDSNGITIAYASIILSNRQYISLNVGQVLDVYISEQEDELKIIPALRSAIDDRFWFHKSTRRS